MVNHYEYISFTTKGILTENLLAHFGGQKISFYPESYLYADSAYDFPPITEAYYKHAIRSFFRVIIRQHRENVSSDWRYNYLDTIPLERTRAVVTFALEQLESFNFDLTNECKWDEFSQLFDDLSNNDWRVELVGQISHLAQQVLSIEIKLGEDLGEKNMWIIKPCHSSRGRGIKVKKNIDDIRSYAQEVYDHQSLEGNKDPTVLIQRYLEKPLVIHARKFDIRQWFLVTSFHPVEAWIFDGCYFRFSGENYTLDSLDDFVHLTNHSIQVTKLNKKKNEFEELFDDQSMVMNMEHNKYNAARNGEAAPTCIGRKKIKAMSPHDFVPVSNMWSLNNFRDWARDQSQGDIWYNKIFPQLKEILAIATVSAAHNSSQRPNTFEFFGADFMLDENYNTFLLEVNRSPDPAQNTAHQREMFEELARDAVTVIVDYPSNQNVDTGRFHRIV